MRTGNLLIFAGVALVAIGLLVRLGWFSWFGRLPGDIRSEGETSTVFIPITSMIVVSVVATILLNVLGRLFRN
jgi:cytosine/uracil/thiamine/allantoin permease